MPHYRHCWCNSDGSQTLIHQFKSVGISQTCMCHPLGRNIHLAVCRYCMAPDFNLQDIFTTLLPQLLFMAGGQELRFKHRDLRHL